METILQISWSLAEKILNIYEHSNKTVDPINVWPMHDQPGPREKPVHTLERSRRPRDDHVPHSCDV